MARTIGTKNKNLVKKLTRQALQNNVENVEDFVIENLPDKLWDTWESADSEIRRIVTDLIFEHLYK